MDRGNRGDGRLTARRAAYPDPIISPSRRPTTEPTTHPAGCTIAA